MTKVVLMLHDVDMKEVFYIAALKTAFDALQFDASH